MWPFRPADRPTRFPSAVKPPEPADTASHYKVLHNGHAWRAVYAAWVPPEWYQADSPDPNDGYWAAGSWKTRDIGLIGSLSSGVIIYDTEALAQQAIEAHQRMPEKPTCATCRFWKVSANDPKWGACRRYPPRATTGPALFIATAPHDWCGEHQPNTTTIHLSSGVTDDDIGTKGHGGESEALAQQAIEAHQRKHGPWREYSRTPTEETPDADA